MTVEPGATLVVIGAGTMGAGIATASAASGYHVRLVDADLAVAAAAVERAAPRIERLRGERPAPSGSLVASGSTEDAVSDADIVIEAVPEIPELKKEIFASLHSQTPAHALLVSNTSTLSITELADAAEQNPRVIGMHFFNPAHRMVLVEVITSPTTSSACLADAVDLARHLGKQPIVVCDTPGFVTSRLGLMLGNEAMRIVEEGVASAADVDTAMRLGYNHPMGPLELADLVGLDARLNNLRSVASRMGRAEFDPPDVLIQHVEAGRLGRKSGQGFYNYDEQGNRLDSAVTTT